MFRVEADGGGRQNVHGEVRRELQNVLAGLLRRTGLAIGGHRVSTLICLGEVKRPHGRSLADRRSIGSHAGMAGVKRKRTRQSLAVRSATVSNATEHVRSKHMNWPGRYARPANEIFDTNSQPGQPRLSTGGTDHRAKCSSTSSHRSHRSRRNRGNPDSRDNHGNRRNGSPKPSAGNRRFRHFPCRTDGTSRGSRQQFLLPRAIQIATAKNSVSAEHPHSAASMPKHRLRAKRSIRQHLTLVPRLWRRASA
jgi:hypothetical protein